MEIALSLSPTALSVARAGVGAIAPTSFATALFFEAKRLITVAEATTTPTDKAAAQAALDAAVAASYVGAASPNTIAEQQARIDAIVGVSFDQTIQVTIGNPTPPAGWNALTGNLIDGDVFAIVDSAGAALNEGLTLIDVGTESYISAGISSGSLIDEIPDPMLQYGIVQSSGLYVRFKFTGLNDAKTYDLVTVASKNGGVTDRMQALEAMGVEQGDKQPAGNVDDPWRVSNISPVAGEIEFAFHRGTDSTYAYANAFVLKRHAA